jgi:hypothetical protein
LDKSKFPLFSSFRGHLCDAAQITKEISVHRSRDWPFAKVLRSLNE